MLGERKGRRKDRTRRKDGRKVGWRESDKRQSQTRNFTQIAFESQISFPVLKTVTGTNNNIIILMEMVMIEMMEYKTV